IRPLPDLWQTSTRARSFRERIVDILRRDFGDSPLFVVKDPRICVLLPLWRNALTDIETDPRFVISVREPLEVAASLASRDGFSTAHSLLLWLKHFLAAELGTRGVRRVFVRYDDLLADWRRTSTTISQALSIEWPRSLD